MQRMGPDHVADTYVASSQSNARETACVAARTLQFIEVTGLAPSKAKRSFPKSQYQNRMPGSDHDLAWYDPREKIYLRTSEPYALNEVSSKQEAWGHLHGWTVVKSPWAGMYWPDGGASLYLMVDASRDSVLNQIVAKLANAPPPIVASKWDGESMAITTVFVSPGQAKEFEAKACRAATSRRKRRADESVNYSGNRRRPKGQMPIERHKLVGRLLRSVLFGTRKRPGVCNRVEKIRGELESWVQCEYDRNALSDDVFFDLYYGELPIGDPLAALSIGCESHIGSLEEVKSILGQCYPQCAPLRELLKRVDLAIVSLRSWGNLVSA